MAETTAMAPVSISRGGVEESSGQSSQDLPGAAQTPVSAAHTQLLPPLAAVHNKPLLWEW